MRIISRRQAVSYVLSSLAIAASATGSRAASRDQIDANVDATLREFSLRVGGARELLAKSAAVLVFPSVIKAGMGIGGEYGEGVLLIRGRPAGYYNTISASVGFQLGAQSRSVIIAFMTPEALASFRRVKGWKVGVDGSVALVTVGIGGSVELEQSRQPHRGLHFRRQRAHVQSDPGGLEDQPHRPLTDPQRVKRSNGPTQVVGLGPRRVIASSDAT